MILFDVSSQSSNLAEEVVSLQNHIAELEDEKGNLQLRLVELDDTLMAQGDTSQLSLYSLLLHLLAFLTPFLLTSYLRCWMYYLFYGRKLEMYLKLKKYILK